MAKIVIIGAGSGFGGRLSVDIMSRPALAGSTLCLCDIHPGRLKNVTAYVQRIIDKHNLPTKLESTVNRAEVFPGADFVVTSISQGGGAYYGEPYNSEILIPRKYGLDQSVADTTSVGAVFRFLRTGPVQQQILRDVERLAPDAIVLNHTNPMPMLMSLHSHLSLRSVGLCHGVQHTAGILAKFLGIPEEELRYKCVGVNHLAWFLEFKHGDADIYPMLDKKLSQTGGGPAVQRFLSREAVRIEIYRQFGAFPTESSKHDSEYLPYFRRTPELMEHYGLEARELFQELEEGKKRRREWENDGIEKGEGTDKGGELQISKEFTTGIMEAVLTDVPFRFNGNIMNTGLITNLPGDCCVEVPCYADSQGINPAYSGALPTQLAALNRSNISVHQLAVEAVLRRDKDAAYHACLVDPNAAALVSIPKIREMFEELWQANKEHLKWFDKSHTGPLPETCAQN